MLFKPLHADFVRELEKKYLYFLSFLDIVKVQVVDVFIENMDLYPT